MYKLSKMFNTTNTTLKFFNKSSGIQKLFIKIKPKYEASKNLIWLGKKFDCDSRESFCCGLGNNFNLYDKRFLVVKLQVDTQDPRVLILDQQMWHEWTSNILSSFVKTLK